MNRPARVLRAITRLNVGGPTRHVALLLRHLPREEFAQLLVHGPAPAHEGEGLLEVPGEKQLVPSLVREIRPARDLAALRHLRRIIRDHRPDVVHTHQGKAGLLARLAAAREKVPLIVHTYHGHTFDRYFGALKGAMIRAAERHAARRSHRIICQSESQANDVARVLGSEVESRLRIIRPAADPAAWQLPVDLPAAERGDRPVILYPARLVAIKRPLLAAEAFASLRTRRDAELWIAGDGPLCEVMAERLQHLGVTEGVRWLGAVRHLAPIYAAADLVLLPSAMEGTPQVLLEAMAAGVPFVATDVGGVRDVAGSVGRLLHFEAGGEEWGRALAEALDRPGDPEPGRERVADLFSVDRMVAETAALYREGLAASG